MAGLHCTAPRTVLSIKGGREEGAPGLREMETTVPGSSAPAAAARSHLYQATSTDRASCGAGRKAETGCEN